MQQCAPIFWSVLYTLAVLGASSLDWAHPMDVPAPGEQSLVRCIMRSPWLAPDGQIRSSARSPPPQVLEDHIASVRAMQPVAPNQA